MLSKILLCLLCPTAGMVGQSPPAGAINNLKRILGVAKRTAPDHAERFAYSLEGLRLVGSGATLNVKGDNVSASFDPVTLELVSLQFGRPVRPDNFVPSESNRLSPAEILACAEATTLAIFNHAGYHPIFLDRNQVEKTGKADYVIGYSGLEFDNMLGYSLQIDPWSGVPLSITHAPTRLRPVEPIESIRRASVAQAKASALAAYASHRPFSRAKLLDSDFVIASLSWLERGRHYLQPKHLKNAAPGGDAMLFYRLKLEGTRGDGSTAVQLAYVDPTTTEPLSIVTWEVGQVMTKASSAPTDFGMKLFSGADSVALGAASKGRIAQNERLFGTLGNAEGWITPAIISKRAPLLEIGGRTYRLDPITHALLFARFKPRKAFKNPQAESAAARR